MHEEKSQTQRVRLAVEGCEGSQGLVVLDADGNRLSEQAFPVQGEWLAPGGVITPFAANYEQVSSEGKTWVGTAQVRLTDGVRLAVRDEWTARLEILDVRREVRVEGNLPEGGFVTGLSLVLPEIRSFAEADLFLPGILYGRTASVTPTAIGGQSSLAEVRHVRVREDRMPAPLACVRLATGPTVAALHRVKDAVTTEEDACDVEATKTLVDERFAFAAVGFELNRDDRVAVGCWLPGAEGEVTYRGDVYPGGQLRQWRRRFWPLQEGLVREFSMSFRFSHATNSPDFIRDSWRWAWHELQPRVVPQDLAACRKALVEVLASQVVEISGKTGIPQAVDAVTAKIYDNDFIMGFTGRSTDSAYHLLARAAEAQTSPEDAARYRQLGRAIIDSFVDGLQIDPPVGEGFKEGKIRVFPFLGITDMVHLRPICEGVRAVLRSWSVEHQQGHEFPAWIAWCQRYGQWLVGKQEADGAFARAFQINTGKVANPSTRSTIAAVPFLLELATATGEKAYREAAIRAGEFAWKSGHQHGLFVGGTIDNPDVLDKEAGTLALEGYLLLYEATRESQWLDRAKAAADFSETWIYAWDVPMPSEPDLAKSLHWKPGISTVGLQLIATGHSLVDAYMAFDVGRYARLSQYTGDLHYREVAAILLHNTKQMLAIPGRAHDLFGPGWQQEHWSLSPPRGRGLHRLWLPWVAVSQLEGLLEAEVAMPELFTVAG